ncbi:hypothetical protein O0I10_002238 [Lichtheimia ornata]|uniref:Arsenate reductase n=1 Tax=Lichtheimia ornata TaxID=688661 RepID=A0AAD7VC94_9FUNG|nr:uncharacterized protein O0I10_002238 [Lichtheimia ornata]KAJ8661907.1 hypothetical protein O0I10_002238 [Lichtheimia ornata]
MSSLPTSGVTILYNPQCTKCRNTKAFLEDEQPKCEFSVEVIQYKKSPPTRETLQALVDYLGMNKEGTADHPWKEDRPWDYLLRPEAQGKVSSFEEAFDLIEQDPAMLERPFVIDWDHKVAVLGRPDMSRVEKMIAAYK